MASLSMATGRYPQLRTVFGRLRTHRTAISHRSGTICEAVEFGDRLARRSHTVS
jgi:hypothetical protein